MLAYLFCGLLMQPFHHFNPVSVFEMSLDLFTKIFFFSFFKLHVYLKTETNIDISCQVRTNTTLHFFAFRTHAHALGKVISGYKVSKAVKYLFFYNILFQSSIKYMCQKFYTWVCWFIFFFKNRSMITITTMNVKFCTYRLEKWKK